MLNELQVKQVKRYLRINNIESRLILGDFMDHLCCMIEQNMSEGASFEDSLRASFSQLPGYEMKKIETYTLKLLNMETSFSSRTSLLATIPFGLFGLAWAFSNSGFNVPALIQMFLLITSVISMFVLLGIGWIKNFPRWSFPAIGFCLLFSMFLMMVSIPGLSDDVLGLWAWIPLLVTLIISLSFKPGIGPVKKIIERIKEEPALILFALYGFTPFFVWILCDEMHSIWMIFIALISTLILSSGIYLFLRSDKKKTRVISMIISGLLAVIFTFTASIIYWK
jgi:peptidoglycan/LPS O-acetylase OafA/YrhL